jgi:hypothetical protein
MITLTDKFGPIHVNKDTILYYFCYVGDVTTTVVLLNNDRLFVKETPEQIEDMMDNEANPQ